MNEFFIKIYNAAVTLSPDIFEVDLVTHAMDNMDLAVMYVTVIQLIRLRKTAKNNLQELPRGSRLRPNMSQLSDVQRENRKQSQERARTTAQ